MKTDNKTLSEALIIIAQEYEQFDSGLTQATALYEAAERIAKIDEQMGRCVGMAVAVTEQRCRDGVDIKENFDSVFDEIYKRLELTEDMK
jgi:sorbitol-specific phosphotransferase system component IIBC